MRILLIIIVMVSQSLYAQKCNVAIELEKEVYHMYEPVVVYLEIKNISTDILYRQPTRWEGTLITNEHGDTVHSPTSVTLISEQVSIGSYYEYKSRETYVSFMHINSFGHGGSQYPVSSFKPGTYYVQYIFKEYAEFMDGTKFNGDLYYSNKLQFKVLEATDQDQELYELFLEYWQSRNRDFKIRLEDEIKLFHEKYEGTPLEGLLGERIVYNINIAPEKVIPIILKHQNSFWVFGRFYMGDEIIEKYVDIDNVITNEYLRKYYASLKIRNREGRKSAERTNSPYLIKNKRGERK
ncbi:MAG: hypothetical protein K9J16_09735 [Melioribacteraceae bacterium]|nr:hypothetical protein [Melioribacteraceae bacterium]MCF8354871.1 hypothetical protein [Melioribacteraceae bacterium]MCF8393907.1 hypothetical protein [Melioribacteraceae bacterium]MCF8419679.1 hypothetical protein [Melioribacteraceae bacterium]